MELLQELGPVAIVGASAAGISAAETLRNAGHVGSITLIGEEADHPYDRPPLSKQILSGEWSLDKIRLRSREHLSGLDLELVLDDAALAVDIENRHVQLSNRVVSFAGLIIATGVRPRTLPTDDRSTALTLRNASDATAIRSAVRTGTTVAVVGAGVLGCEVAATLCATGAKVTVVGQGRAPMAGHFGMEVGAAIGNVHRSNGVRLLLDSPAERVVRLDTGSHSVRLRNGDHITADVVIAAVGSIPNVDWLRSSGLNITDGVVCDSRCAAAPNVYAAGDIASWYSNRFGRRLRVEHRVNATEQANAAAMNLLGAARDYDPVPYFWTHQFADRIQMYGIRPSGTEVTAVLGSLEERRFVGVYEEHGVVVGAIGWNSAKQMLRMRSHIVEGARLDEILA